MAALMTGLLLLGALTYTHWITLPAMITKTKDLSRKMPTRQLILLERVRRLLRWKMLSSIGIFTLVGIDIFLAWVFFR